GVPELCGGGTIDLVTTDRVEWTGLPDRDEAGSPNVVGALALARSIMELKKIGMDVVAKHEAELKAYALQELIQIPKLKIYGDGDPSNSKNRLGVIPFTIQGMHLGLVPAIL